MVTAEVKHFEVGELYDKLRDGGNPVVAQVEDGKIDELSDGVRDGLQVELGEV